MARARRPTARDLIADGVLTTWLLDSRSARQLGMVSTGHAARGTGGPPSPSPTNLYLDAGALSPAELMADIKLGLYVNELIGMGVNGVTGDYSRGAAGFMIRDGAIAEPVAELTIASNLLEMFAHLTPANDLRFRRGTNSPTRADRRHDDGRGLKPGTIGHLRRSRRTPIPRRRADPGLGGRTFRTCAPGPLSASLSNTHIAP